MYLNGPAVADDYGLNIILPDYILLYETVNKVVQEALSFEP